MNNKHKIAILAASILLVIVVSISVVSAGSSGWDIFWKEAGKWFGITKAEQTDLPVASGDSFQIGTAGDTFTSAKSAQIIFSPDSRGTIVSTSAFGVENTSGVQRIISEAPTCYIEGADGTVGEYGVTFFNSVLFDMSTSSAATTSSTNPLHTFSAFSTGTAIQMLSASTTFDVWTTWKRVWEAGDFITFKFDRNVSSTEGYCEVPYKLLN